jgi:hypothetical protein
MEAVSRGRTRAWWLIGVVCATALCGPRAADAADLRPETIAAFDRYAQATERRIAIEVGNAATFLRIDTLPAGDRQAGLDRLRRGEVLIERLTTMENGRSISIPDGLVHHWVGVAFLPKVSRAAAVALLQDYGRHGEVYRPRIERSALRSRSGNLFRFYLRLFMKKGITVVINSEHEARFEEPAADRAYSRIVSTRMAEVEHPGTAQEREKPVGHDGGYLWRLNSYWRFLERDGGTYLQCESLSLTRDIPFGLGWLVGPFVTSLPRESLEFTLTTTRAALTTPPR